MREGIRSPERARRRIRIACACCISGEVEALSTSIIASITRAEYSAAGTGASSGIAGTSSYGVGRPRAFSQASLPICVGASSVAPILKVSNSGARSAAPGSFLPKIDCTMLLA